MSVQHELLRNMSVTVGYYRRQFYNIATEPNFAVDRNFDYTPFTVRGPTHPNLPRGGGELITLYNLNPNKAGVSNEIRINLPGLNLPGRSRVYNGFEISVNARFPGGFAFGGITTEREAIDNCADQSNPNSLRFCQRTPPFRSLDKASAGYLLPHDIQIAGSRTKPAVPVRRAVGLVEPQTSDFSSQEDVGRASSASARVISGERRRDTPKRRRREGGRPGLGGLKRSALLSLSACSAVGMNPRRETPVSCEMHWRADACD